MGYSRGGMWGYTQKPTSVVTLASKVAAPEFTPASRAEKCEHFVVIMQSLSEADSFPPV